MNYSRGAGGHSFRYCDLELNPLTFISELDLDVIHIYQCAKRKFLFHLLQKLHSKRTHGHTKRQKHRRNENITSPHTRAVKSLKFPNMLPYSADLDGNILLGLKFADIFQYSANLDKNSLHKA